MSVKLQSDEPHIAPTLTDKNTSPDAHSTDPPIHSFVEDNHLHLTSNDTQYKDPSDGYDFVNFDLDWRSKSNLDNSETLLRQLEDLGVRVPSEYLTLDIEANLGFASGSSSYSSYSMIEEEINDSMLYEENKISKFNSEESLSTFNCKNSAQTDIFKSFKNCDTSDQSLNLKSDKNTPANIRKSDENTLKNCISKNINYSHENSSNSSKITVKDCLESDEEGLQSNYQSPILSQADFQEYLRIVHDDENTILDLSSLDLNKGVNKMPKKSEAASILMKKLSSKIVTKLKMKLDKLKSQGSSFDAMTPDSGVHDNFSALTVEEQERQREEWKAELAKTEDEIQTLRQVLASKVKHAQDVKRRLGITVWREFSDDISTSFKTVRESQTYQKTAGAMSAVSEKTGAIFGGIGAKFGQLKETPTFKSFEERVGSVYTTAKTKIGGAESNSTQDFEEALREAEQGVDTSNGVPPGAPSTNQMTEPSLT